MQRNHTLKSVHVDFSRLLDSGLSPEEFSLCEYFFIENYIWKNSIKNDKICTTKLKDISFQDKLMPINNTDILILDYGMMFCVSESGRIEEYCFYKAVDKEDTYIKKQECVGFPSRIQALCVLIRKI